MSLPFFLFAAGLVAVWRGSRAAALGLWGLGLAVLLVLFRLHATDTLSIAL